MKLWIRSDLHTSLADLVASWDDVPVHDVAILAGDVAVGLVSQIDAIDSVAERPVILVPGNHEYWHRCMQAEQMAAGIAAARSRRVRLLDVDAVTIGGVRFLGGTLWTDFGLYGSDARSLAMTYAQSHNGDFSLIMRDEETSSTPGPRPLWTPTHARRAHTDMRVWLDGEFAKPFAGPTVVVSHHAPSLRSVAERWRSDAGTPAYASRLDASIERWAPALWVHGHVHDSADYRIGSTRVVCNPAGIGSENEDFDPGLVVEI